MDLGLKGKRVFITGSSRGIGRACADAFLKEGAIVAINGRNENRLQETAISLKSTYGERVLHIAADILTDDGTTKIQHFIMDELQGIDIYVANLGSGKAENDNSLDVSEWRRFYDINVLGNLRILDIIHATLKEGSKPSVTFISSVIAKEASKAPVGYAAAKSAVITLTKYLSKSWAGDGIRVNCVLPGNVYFKGGRWEELEKEDPRGVSCYVESTVPMKRFGKPAEIADAVVFLSSERASFVTGAELAVDGGQINAI